MPKGGPTEGGQGATGSVSADTQDLTPDVRGATAAAPSRSELGFGDCVGRYTLRELLGAGGMGRVFAATDPKLGRTVAVKLIHPERAAASALARVRLMREAQALARLRHPNVVTVHDVGAQDGEIFIAMELVEGPTLTEWLRPGRSTREILATFVAAGRGLAAAHAAAIVHRDFKPANVIVGADRVVVVDFGLARAGDPEPDEHDPADATPVALDLSLTATGERLGTPHYMAPEALAGEPVTAHADQFSFCVALWGALHREPPAAGAPVARRREVPAWLNAAVARGLQPNPRDRWPTMEALLEVLARDRAAPRRRLVLAAGVVVLGGAAAVAAMRPVAVDLCAGAGARLAGVWDEPRKGAVRAAFAATGLPFADASWRAASARLDDYAARWVDMAGEACRASRVEGWQSAAVMDLRMACLDTRRAVLAALIERWGKGLDAEGLAAAADGARGLPRLDECADARALTERAPLPGDPAAAGRIAAVRARLAGGDALVLARRWAEARPVIAAARTAAEATGWAQVRAEAARAHGLVLLRLEDPAGEEALKDAVRLAGMAHDDRLAAQALVDLVDQLAQNQQSAERALLAADLAEGAVARAGADAALRAQLLASRAAALEVAGRYDAAAHAYAEARQSSAAAFGASDGATLRIDGGLARVAQLRGDFRRARELHEENLAATASVLGAEHPQVAIILSNLGDVQEELGELDASVASYRRALAIKDRVYGPDAASTAVTLNNLGGLELERGDFATARVVLERALAIRERVLGAEHPYVATTLANLALVRARIGDQDEALRLARRALEVNHKAYGPEHRKVAFALSVLGEVLDSGGDDEGALENYRLALDIRRKALGEDHAYTQESRVEVAWVLERTGRCAEARALAATAASAIEKKGAGSSPYLAQALAIQGACDLREKKAREAHDRIARALAILEGSGLEPTARGRVRWLLAQALDRLGQRDAAQAAATRAQTELAANATAARERSAARAWLAARHR